MCRGCDNLKKTIGGTLRAKTFIAILYYHFESSDFSSKPTHDSLLQRNTLSALPAARGLAAPNAHSAAARFAPRKLSGD